MSLNQKANFAAMSEYQSCLGADESSAGLWISTEAYAEIKKARKINDLNYGSASNRQRALEVSVRSGEVVH
jgi:hypothetical protein